MINNIVNTFYRLAKQHKLIKTFVYNQVSKLQGIGGEKHPLFFLEDSILVSQSNINDGMSQVQVNFEVLLTPQFLENYDVEQPTVEDCQNLAYHIALNIIAKMREEYNDGDSDIYPNSYSFITLRNYYDNAAAGVRCSLNLKVRNDISFCDLDEHFDENKEFEVEKYLSDIKTDNPISCEGEYGFKLPKITI